MNTQTADFIDQLGSRGRLQAGSSLKFCLNDKGLTDAYSSFVPTCECDTADAHAIVEAAG